MHLHRNELKDRALSLWTKYTVAGTSFTSVSPCSLLSASDRSNSWLLRVHHALPALVRRRRPRHRLFPRVSRAGPEALDRRRVLLYAPARPGVLSQSGPSLEVVRPPFPFRMRADAHGRTATSARTCPRRTTSRRRFNSTTSPTTGRGRNSAYRSRARVAC